MRILVAGEWQWPWYEQACAEALCRLIHEVQRFFWAERFVHFVLERVEPISLSKAAELQNRVLWGPTVFAVKHDLLRAVELSVAVRSLASFSASQLQASKGCRPEGGHGTWLQRTLTFSCTSSLSITCHAPLCWHSARYQTGGSQHHPGAGLQLEVRLRGALYWIIDEYLNLVRIRQRGLLDESMVQGCYLTVFKWPDESVSAVSTDCI